MNTCSQCRPGKPVLAVDVNDDGVATFTWDDTANTTHYNVWLAKKNAGGDWESIEQVFYAESGFQRTFGEGEYKAQLLSYSSQMWEPDGSDWVHTWADDIYFSVVDECRHNYTATHVDATCVDYGYTTYTCTECGDTYTVYDGDYTEWSTTKPSGVDEDLIETKTQYRYADKETTTSYETSLSGWTQVGGEWKQSGTGSVQYVKSWPSGFLTSHSLYGTYNNSPMAAGVTNTSKTTIDSDQVTGYLYFHWCRGDYQNGPDNRKSRPTKQEDCDTFCAFYSTTPPSSLTAASDGDGSYRYENGSCCKDSFWYFYTPVNTQNYSTYRKLFTYERWGDWSDWSDTVYTGSSSRKVETRTLYRAVEAELGDHDYQNGYCTVCGAEDPDYNFVPVILTVADVSAAPGDTVTIPVTISDNTGFAGFTLCVDYNDSVMTLTNIAKGSLLNTSESGAFTKNVSGKTINWVDSANIMGDGELMKLTFTIDADATPGSYDVGLSLKDGNSSNFVDENSHAIHVEFEGGIVSVQEPAPVVTLEKIEVATMPSKTVYQIGESLNTTGLTLKATYSDGTTKMITSGYTVSGFDSATAGTKTVTVSYEGKKTTFTVTVNQQEADPDAPKIVINSVKATAGDTVTVEAKLENNPGISSVSMKIDYDTTRLKLESAEFGAELSTGAFTNYNLPYITLVRSGDCTGDVLLVTLTFSVLTDAEAGVAYVHLEYEEGDITNYDEEDVNFEVIPGVISVECAHAAKTAVPAKNADCENEGNRLYYVCDSCGVVLKADGVTETTVAAETIAALGHVWGNWVMIQKPTASVEGVEERTCTRCGHTEQRSVAKLQNPFTDVEPGSFFYDPVMWAVENDITKGTDDTHFSPDLAVNRAQVVTFLWRAAGSPEPTSTNNPFVDVAEGDFYYKAVLWAVENGVTKGTDATHFAPSLDCNRAQVVTFLWRAAGKPEATGAENPFVDVAEGDFFYDAVLWAVEAGVTKGVSTTAFGVDGICNRAQVVTFLYRTYNN